MKKIVIITGSAFALIVIVFSIAFFLTIGKLLKQQEAANELEIKYQLQQKQVADIKQTLKEDSIKIYKLQLEKDSLKQQVGFLKLVSTQYENALSKLKISINEKRTNLNYGDSSISVILSKLPK